MRVDVSNHSVRGSMVRWRTANTTMGRWRVQIHLFTKMCTCFTVGHIQMVILKIIVRSDMDKLYFSPYAFGHAS